MKKRLSGEEKTNWEEWRGRAGPQKKDKEERKRSLKVRDGFEEAKKKKTAERRWAPGGRKKSSWLDFGTKYPFRGRAPGLAGAI